MYITYYYFHIHLFNWPECHSHLIISSALTFEMMFKCLGEMLFGWFPISLNGPKLSWIGT